MKKKLKIKKIKSPYFYVVRDKIWWLKVKVNEYELRQIQLDVANGILPHGIIIRDMRKNESIVLANGSLSEKLYGYSLGADLAIQLNRLQRAAVAFN
jgi:hypothetical protein